MDTEAHDPRSLGVRSVHADIRVAHGQGRAGARGRGAQEGQRAGGGDCAAQEEHERTEHQVDRGAHGQPAHAR